MAVVRVKRRLQDDPKEVLVLTYKKPRTESALFKFAATVEKPDENVSVHIRQAVNLKGFQSNYQKTVKNITEKFRAENRTKSRCNRLKVVNCFRAIDYSSLSENEEFTTEDGGKTLTVLDLESCDGRNDETKGPSSTKDIETTGENMFMTYIILIALMSRIQLQESYSSGYGINQELIVEEFQQNEEDNESCEPDDEDDSNDENNWRNDYPDEDEWRSDGDDLNADEDDLEYNMRRCNLDERSDLSSDYGEEDLVYNDEVDPKDVYHFGNEYAKYKARINNSVEDLSDDEG